MAVLPHPWDIYASHQAALAKKSVVDDAAWGIEAVMNRLLASDIPNDTASIAASARMQASADRRSRYDRALLTKFSADAAPCPSDFTVQLEARSELVLLEERLPAVDFQILRLVAEGEDRGDVEDRFSMTAAALRARVCRARAAGRLLLAA